MSLATQRYGAVAMILHWIMALGILALLAIGLIMVHGSLDPGTMFRLFQLHKSIGITILLAALLRLIWRLLHRPPVLPASMAQHEIRLAKLGHFLLYGEMFFLPLTGWALVSSSVFAIPTVLFGLISWPDLPYLPHLADKRPVEAVFTTLHAYGAYFLMAVLALHILAVLRHHFILRDAVLMRMLPSWRRTRHKDL
ncbi:cytochrome b [Asaia spathodeae]|uniref:cytochrome b n=1 Tax=Asaia spathodeae TaxID=657016 RepID=UPI002FC2CBEE